MNNIFQNNSLAQFKSMCMDAQSVAIVSHSNPDGDAIGSGLALLRFLEGQGIKARFFVPNRYPEFLGFIDPSGNQIEVFNIDPAASTAYIAASDLIVCVDFNDLSRLERMTPVMDSNIHAPRVLIDHHQAPSLEQFAVSFSEVGYSSTALMIYDLVMEWGGCDTLTKEVAEALYLGIMTDTGCFSFGNLTPWVYRAVADLVAVGVDVVEINRQVFNTQSVCRTKMVGYLISEKMVVNPAKSAAYITLTMDEKAKFNHQIGDTEGIVNMPLAIKGIIFSAILIQSEDCIKLSLRSQGDKVDVNLLAREYFNGGGHKNAAGGKFFGTMEQAIAQLEMVIGKM